MTRPAITAFATTLMLGSALALAACHGSNSPNGTQSMEKGTPVKNGTTTVPTYAGTKFAATLDGKAEVPGPGADGATGEVTVWVDTDANKVCYLLGVAGLDSPTMAHIHKGVAGVAGDAVVTLDNPATMTSQGCKDVDHDLANDIKDHPGDYYVNVHNGAHPKGAIRGQLAAASD